MHGRGEFIEGRRHRVAQRRPGRAQMHALVAAFEQGHAERVFERTYRAAERAVGSRRWIDRAFGMVLIGFGGYWRFGARALKMPRH